MFAAALDLFVFRRSRFPRIFNKKIVISFCGTVGGKLLKNNLTFYLIIWLGEKRFYECRDDRESVFGLGLE